jgi:hypothetical protein
MVTGFGQGPSSANLMHNHGVSEYDGGTLGGCLGSYTFHMKPPVEIPPAVRANLASIYEEVMWLAERPNTTPSAARAWYTHVAVHRLRRDVRRFTGKVSHEAATDEGAILRLEHFMRIQTTLTQLVARHLKTETRSAAEFISIVLEYEQVHIVTLAENYAAMKAKGDYLLAGISLVDWRDLPAERQRVLWRKVLNGRVSNAAEFADQA